MSVRGYTRRRSYHVNRADLTQSGSEFLFIEYHMHILRALRSALEPLWIVRIIFRFDSIRLRCGYA